MELKDVFLKAGGKAQVARICGVTWQSVLRWERANKMPESEWSGRTDYARRICDQAKLLGHTIHPIDICPMSGPYMQMPNEKAA